MFSTLGVATVAILLLGFSLVAYLGLRALVTSGRDHARRHDND